MGRGCKSDNSNIYYQARKNASIYDERLCSRERASEIIGVSQSTLADYELGNTKFVPVDKVKIMADVYNRPDLETHYCKYECPIGKDLPLATEVRTIEGIAIHLLRTMKKANLKKIKAQLVELADEGEISEEGQMILENMTESLREVAISINEMELLVRTLRNGGKTNDIRRITREI